MIARRGFLGLILASASAPAIVKASSLMKIVVPSQEIYRYSLPAWQPGYDRPAIPEYLFTIGPGKEFANMTEAMAYIRTLNVGRSRLRFIVG